jgi:hypothetical protein
MEWLKQWKAAAQETVKANRSPFHYAHLVIVFGNLVHANDFKLFSDVSKLKDILNLLASLVDTLGSTEDAKRAYRIAGEKLRHIFAKVPQVFELMVEIVSVNPSAKSCTLIEQLLVFITQEKKALFDTHKAKFIDFYDKIVLSTRGKQPPAVKKAFVPLLKAVTAEDFKDKLLPVVQRQAKRSPDCLGTLPSSTVLKMLCLTHHVADMQTQLPTLWPT